MTGHFLGCSPPGSTIRPRLASELFFFFSDWLHNRIPREWAGVGRPRAAWGSKKWALSPADNAIISAPLARNARFHRPLLLSVRQSKLRQGPAGFHPPPPKPPTSPAPSARSHPQQRSPSNQILQAHSGLEPPTLLPPRRRLAGGGKFAQLDRALIDSSNQATVSVLKLTNKQTADRLDSIRVREAQQLRDEHETTQQLQLLAPEFVSSLWRRCKS